ncbi:MAG TPA: membrane protein insertase YidC [Nitrospiraceae bacterium]|nr:membrane protein insertase YidC [Nitrospiraceae bacterium]
MEKRVIVFLLISLAVIVGYDYLLKEFGLSPQSNEQQSESGPLEKGKEGSPRPEASPSSPQSTRPSPSNQPAPSPSAKLGGKMQGAENTHLVASSPDEQTVEIETNLYRARLSNRGAVIKAWELKRYTTSGPTGSQPIQLVYEGGKFKAPLSLTVPDQGKTDAIQQGLYRVSQDRTHLDASNPTAQVIFQYEDPVNHLMVRKQLTFHHDSYLVDIRVASEGLPASIDVNLGTNFGIVEWGEGFIGLMGAAFLVDDKVVKDTPDAEIERKGEVKWVALQDKYFLSVLIPSGASAAIAKKEGDKLASSAVRFGPPPPESDLSLQLFAGPKEYDTLKSFNIGLEDTIDFGWFIFGSWSFVKVVAKPIFYVLRYLYEFTHNYGLSIILLTVGIKLMFAPLQYKSYKSMKQMQVIQPKVAAVQAKFKDDRDRLNKELIKLYRDHKVNPVGGCLPMVLQMPVFVALFNILFMTIDLRGAPFILWIKDLSVQDPYYILPIIMGVSMVAQQKMMPTTMDPTQAKIMLVLPAFMTFLFINFPAGLVLYWLTNNILTITQQVLTDRFFSGKWHVPGLDSDAEGKIEATEQKVTTKRRKDQAH